MGALIRAYDWSATRLGPPTRWPQGLKTAVRFLLSTGHPMFIWWGPELIQFYNDAYRRSIGPERHPGALGQGGRECWDEIWDIIGPQIEQVMAGEGHTWHENQLVPITRHGRREDVYWTYSYGPIDEPTVPNGVGGVLVVCTETTDQVLTERRLKESEARKDEFLAMLAHELRNPLAPIRNASELLQRSTDLSETRAIGELLGRQVGLLIRLVDDLLDVSRITQDRIELQREPLDLEEAVSLAIESVQPLLTERRHRVVRTASAEPLYVAGDVTRIVQCVANLLTNAAKFTPEGGRIEVVLRRDGRTGFLEVIDDGRGIPAEMLPKVFELFMQGDRSLDRSQGGLGIGLSVVRRLVRMHGGEIDVESGGLGQGSTFRIRLPLIDPPAARPAQPVAGASLPRRVLIVDDNIDVAESLALLLKLRGHETAVAYGGREAIERARGFGADVVLLDIGLPEMDGYEVARRIRAAGNDSALIAVTGYGRAEDVERARQAGFDDHLTKPVALADLERVLAQLGAYAPPPD